MNADDDTRLYEAIAYLRRAAAVFAEVNDDINVDRDTKTKLTGHEGDCEQMARAWEPRRLKVANPNAV